MPESYLPMLVIHDGFLGAQRAGKPGPPRNQSSMRLMIRRPRLQMRYIQALAKGSPFNAECIAGNSSRQRDLRTEVLRRTNPR